MVVPDGDAQPTLPSEAMGLQATDKEIWQLSATISPRQAVTWELDMQPGSLTALPCVRSQWVADRILMEVRPDAA